MAAILVVDDDETIRDTLYDLFAEEHLCHSADTAELALKYLQDETYDVILTDISMPGLSGVELLGHIRQQQPNTLVIMISGISDKNYAQTLIGQMGAFDYLLKPFKLEEVEECVARAIERHRQLADERR